MKSTWEQKAGDDTTSDAQVIIGFLGKKSVAGIPSNLGLISDIFDNLSDFVCIKSLTEPG